MFQDWWLLHVVVASAVVFSSLAVETHDGVDVPSHPGFSERRDPELLAKIAAKRFVVQEPGKPPVHVTVKDYAKSLREQGLASRVAPGKISTPNKLQDTTVGLLKQVRDAISKLRPRSLKEILTSLPPNIVPKQKLAEWETSIPWVHVVRRLLEKACTSPTDLSIAGSAKHLEAFPFCLRDYLQMLPYDTKRALGQHLRYTMSNTTHVDEMFSVKHGVCLPVRAALELPTDFCQNVFNLFTAIPYFVEMSTLIQSIEKEYYGAGVAMLELRATPETRAQKLERRIQELQARRVFKSLWTMLAVIPFDAEKEHLIDVWYTDDVHKWRYAIGLFLWMTTTGVWLSNESAQLASETAATLAGKGLPV